MIQMQTSCQTTFRRWPHFTQGMWIFPYFINDLKTRKRICPLFFSHWDAVEALPTDRQYHKSMEAGSQIFSSWHRNTSNNMIHDLSVHGIIQRQWERTDHSVSGQAEDLCKKQGIPTILVAFEEVPGAFLSILQIQLSDGQNCKFQRCYSLSKNYCSQYTLPAVLVQFHSFPTLYVAFCRSLSTSDATVIGDHSDSGARKPERLKTRIWNRWLLLWQTEEIDLATQDGACDAEQVLQLWGLLQKPAVRHLAGSGHALLTVIFLRKNLSLT